MAGSVNKVILVGNLGKDPEIRTMQNGDKVANLSIATSESWNDKNSGERKEKTEWHRVSIMNHALAEIAERYLKKGSTVYLEGSLQTRKWTDKEGTEKFSTEVVIGRLNGVLTMLGGKDSGNQEQRPHDAPKAAAGGGGGWIPPAELDDDIPFATSMDFTDAFISMKGAKTCA